MSRPSLEVADILRDHGMSWRRANAGHVSLDQMKVMSAIECCRTAALGGHVARCDECDHTAIAYVTGGRSRSMAENTHLTVRRRERRMQRFKLSAAEPQRIQDLTFCVDWRARDIAL